MGATNGSAPGLLSSVRPAREFGALATYDGVSGGMSGNGVGCDTIEGGCEVFHTQAGLGEFITCKEV